MDKSALEIRRTLDSKVLEWTQRHPLKILTIVSCLIWTATVVLFVYVYVPSELKVLRNQLTECETSKLEAEGKIPIPPNDPNELSLTPVQVTDEFSAREGRDAEQASFVKSLIGKNINWDVQVDSVDKDLGYLHFKLPGRARRSEPVTMAVFVGDTAKRAMSLKSGDIIRLHGKLSLISNRQVDVDSAEFEFLPTGTPSRP